MAQQYMQKKKKKKKTYTYIYRFISLFSTGGALPASGTRMLGV